MAVIVLWASAPLRSQEQTGDNGTSEATAPESAERYYFYGTVIQENESPPPIGTVIELDCGITLTRVADVSPIGQFHFMLGDPDRTRQLQPDASIGYIDPFFTQAFEVPYDVQVRSSSGTEMSIRTKLASCELRAQVSGYRSSVVKLEGMAFTQQVGVGTITIYPVDKSGETPASAAAQKAQKKAKKLLDKAIKALKKEKLKDAESLLKSAVAEYPDYSEGWLQLGILYQQQKRDADARKALKKAIAIDKWKAMPYMQLGWIATRQGALKEAQGKRKEAEAEWVEAMEATERAIELEPLANPEAYYLSAMAYFNLNNPVLAEKRARRILQIDSRHQYPRAHLILAYLMARDKDYEGAIEEFKNYLKYAPNDAEADGARKAMQECEAQLARAESEN